MRYMQAAVAPNNQPLPAATGFSVQPGTMAWYVISHYSRHITDQQRVSGCESLCTDINGSITHEVTC